MSDSRLKCPECDAVSTTDDIDEAGDDDRDDDMGFVYCPQCGEFSPLDMWEEQ